ncbi:hypothetical protein H7F51_08445 [Novosphingobium flavum]|uniref:Uncharacterized protein n=1 Tax=Novosphingobium flavum TaxID=1778672 RepID=A0A7X1KLT0_9SPHN|nr:DUF6628 family protein [Novosphingobium flavum]MBC2665550.1 hypothetical protein [Novosphingobium flavum]
MATRPAPASAQIPALRRTSSRRALLNAPQGAADRLTLFALRRMALAGLNDAVAANAMFNGFGIGFRRPLVLLRATMLELSAGAARTIALAPGCCRKMTADEARILAVLRHAPADEPRARRHLARLTGAEESPRVLCTASAYGWALRDLGRPLGS